MSTILKALRRLEREKSAQEARPLKDEVTAAPAPGSRRGFPLLALLISAGALGLGLGASLLWLWPRQDAAPEVAAVAEAPRAPRRAGLVPAAPAAVAALPAPTPVPAPAIPAPPPEASVASPPPVAVISLPEPPRVVEPEPPAPMQPPEPVAAKPAPPERGSLPPFARRQARAAVEPPPPAPAQKLARAEVPGVVVSSTVWHPQRDRRLAMVSLEGGAARELHEGDAIGSLVVSEIGPSGVVFLHDGVELRRRVGAKN